MVSLRIPSALLWKARRTSRSGGKTWCFSNLPMGRIAPPRVNIASLSPGSAPFPSLWTP